MRAVLVFFLLGMIAMAAAQGVNVVDNNPEQVNVVDGDQQVNFVDNPDVHVVNNNRPGGGNYGGFRPDRPIIVNGGRPGNVHFVDNNPGYNPGQVNFVNNNPNDPTSVNFVNNNPNDPTSVNFVNNNPNDPTAVHVVDNNPYDPSAVHVVNNNPYDPSAVHVVNNNPYDPTAVHVVNNNPGQVNLNNPDPGFARPEYVQPDISPAWAPNPSGRPPYPYKQYANQYARGG